jgi:hypothetical protein
MTKAEAFLAGYMDKEAGIGDAFAKVTGGAFDKTTDASKAALLLGAKGLAVAPILAGAGLGTVISQANAPGRLDEEALQKELEALELQEFESELKRRRAIAKRQERQQAREADIAERSLRI